MFQPKYRHLSFQIEIPKHIRHFLSFQSRIMGSSSKAELD